MDYNLFCIVILFSVTLFFIITLYFLVKNVIPNSKDKKWSISSVVDDCDLTDADWTNYEENGDLGKKSHFWCDWWEDFYGQQEESGGFF